MIEHGMGMGGTGCQGEKNSATLHLKWEGHRLFELFKRTRPKPAYGRQGIDWIVGPGYSFGVFSMSQCLTLRLRRSAQLMIQKRYLTNRGIQLTSFGSKTLRHSRGAPTDLLWSKKT